MIIGIDYDDTTKLILEYIKYNKNISSIRFGFHKSLITSIQFNEHLNTLFVGDSSGRLLEYSLENPSFPKIVKEYGFLDIGCVICSTQFDSLLVVGGYNGKFIIIDMKTREIVARRRTAISHINSIKFCKLQNNKRLALIVCGDYFNDSKYKSDIFDVSDFLKYNENKIITSKKPSYLNM